MRKITLLMAALCAFSTQAGITVSDCVIREPAPGMNMTAAYLTLEYTNSESMKQLRLPSPESVVGASISDISDNVEIHKTQMVDGTTKMVRIPSLRLKEGKTLLKPGGLHLMLKGLKIRPKAGETYPVKLWMTYTEDLKCEALVKTSAEINADQG
ncbi:copper chaperone PCu(A)C [Photobacterium sp. J15]|uniref:copper chaperone PCu(A)C n=1 Tax=Photobacterium sp. J15 TaxID=265901 RepID=UPI0007E41717|nr:copper chaperone PCu(A)C [Photobacterium sp. J15]